MRGVRYKVKHNAFSVTTPESLYWAGFLFADIALTRKRSTALSIVAARRTKSRYISPKVMAGLVSI